MADVKQIAAVSRNTNLRDKSIVAVVYAKKKLKWRRNMSSAAGHAEKAALLRLETYPLSFPVWSLRLEFPTSFLYPITDSRTTEDTVVAFTSNF
jgi:hypothetical protein